MSGRETGLRPSGWRKRGTGSVRRGRGGWLAFAPQTRDADGVRHAPLVAGPVDFKHQATAALDAWLRERGGEG